VGRLRSLTGAEGSSTCVMHILLCPGAGSVTRTHYEINLDQRILDPEICMHACVTAQELGPYCDGVVRHASNTCMAGRPAVIPSHLWRIIARKKLMPSLKI
jgi:hypothetical protein